MKNGKYLKGRKEMIEFDFLESSSIVHEQTRCYTRIKAMR